MRLLVLCLFLLYFVSCRSHRLTQFFQNGEIVSATAVYEEIPFELVAGLIVLEVTINERIRKFILDTGAPNVISTDLASEINPKTILNGSVSDSQNQEQTLPFVEVEHIKIGGLTFNGFGAVVADWSNIPVLECLEIDGLLGANLMRRLFWQIDYQDQVIRIGKKLDQLVFTPDTIGIPFSPSRQGSPYIKLKFEDFDHQRVLVDLGSTKSIELSDKAFRQLSEGYGIESISSVGFGSTGLYGSVLDTSWHFIAPEFTIEDHSFPSQLAEASSDESGTLGNGFFQQFQTTFDWQNNRIYLKPTPALPESKFISHGLTFAFQNNELIIGAIHQGSPADQTALEVGQKVTRVDQYDFQTDPFETYCQYRQNTEYLKALDILEFEVLISGQPMVIQLPKTTLLPM